MSDNEGDDQPRYIMAAATAKLPNFYPKNAELWFFQAEAEFDIQKITVDRTKYSHVVKMLDQDTARRMATFMKNPPAENKYEALKARLLDTFSLSDIEKADGILDPPPLGDTKVSIYLDNMLHLLGDEPVGLLFKRAFTRQMPMHVQAALNQMKNADVRQLAKTAEELIELHSRKSVAEPTFAVNDATGVCRIHRKYGEAATNCIKPCSYRSPAGSGNATAGRR